jgi:hypothetical protein
VVCEKWGLVGYPSQTPPNAYSNLRLTQVGSLGIRIEEGINWSALAGDFRTFLESGASFELAFLTA